MSIVEIFGNVLLFIAAVIMIAVWPFTKSVRVVGFIVPLSGLALLALLIWSWLS